MPSLPTPSDLARHWALDPGVVYLNHGSYGACPISVLDAQRRHVERMERDAVRFFVHDVWALLDDARARLAPIVGAPPADLVWVPNATHGVAAVFDNLDLNSGDEILVTGHEYPACVSICADRARRAGAAVIAAQLPWPIRSPGDVVDAVVSKVSPRTRVVLLSQVTSSSGLILPVEPIIERARAVGADVILDAAHAPNFVDLDLQGLGVPFAVANCHKWLCAPKGSAVLYVRPDRQAGFRPRVLSVYAEHLEAMIRARGRRQHQLEFDYVGTRDVSAHLATADAIDFLEGVVPGGRLEVRRRTRALCLAARDLVCDRFGIEPPAPDTMLGSMAALPLPPAPPGARPPANLWDDPLKASLQDRHRVQVPIWSAQPGTGRADRGVRISAFLYNSLAQYAYLCDALEAEFERERR